VEENIAVVLSPDEDVEPLTARILLDMRLQRLQ
jgi:hypothetical protein